MSKTPRTDELAAIINRAKLDHGDMWYHEVIKWLKSELTAAKEKIAELERKSLLTRAFDCQQLEAQIKALRKAVVCAEVALLDTAPCARADCNQEQKPSYDIAIAAIDAALKK